MFGRDEYAVSYSHLETANQRVKFSTLQICVLLYLPR